MLESGFRRAYFVRWHMLAQRIVSIFKTHTDETLPPRKSYTGQESATFARPRYAIFFNMPDSTKIELHLEDEQLIRDTLDGKKEAFGELVRKHQGLILDLAMRIVRNREEAEDVCQQV